VWVCAAHRTCGNASKSSKTLNACWFASAMRSTAGSAHIPLIVDKMRYDLQSDLEACDVELIAEFL